jgi:hypothetical protein
MPRGVIAMAVKVTRLGYCVEVNTKTCNYFRNIYTLNSQQQQITKTTTHVQPIILRLTSSTRQCTSNPTGF